MQYKGTCRQCSAQCRYLRTLSRNPLEQVSSFSSSYSSSSMPSTLCSLRVSLCYTSPFPFFLLQTNPLRRWRTFLVFVPSSTSATATSQHERRYASQKPKARSKRPQKSRRRSVQRRDCERWRKRGQREQEREKRGKKRQHIRSPSLAALFCCSLHRKAVSKSPQGSRRMRHRHRLLQPGLWLSQRAPPLRTLLTLPSIALPSHAPRLFFRAADAAAAGDDVDTARSAEDIGVGSASTHRRAPFCFFALTLCAR